MSPVLMHAASKHQYEEGVTKPKGKGVFDLKAVGDNTLHDKNRFTYL